MRTDRKSLRSSSGLVVLMVCCGAAFGQSDPADNGELFDDAVPFDRIAEDAEAVDSVAFDDPDLAMAGEQLEVLVAEGEMSSEEFKVVMQLLRIAELREPRRTASGADGMSIDWHTIDGGGGYSAGGDFELEGTIGQPDAGDMSGGEFALHGGFWQPAASGGCGDCPTDADGDGSTGSADLPLLLGAWGEIPDGAPQAVLCLDGDGDGFIGSADLPILLGAWGPCP